MIYLHVDDISEYIAIMAALLETPVSLINNKVSK